MVIVTSNNNLKENKKPIQEMIFLDKLRRIGSSDLNLKFISNKFNKLSRFVTWKLFDYPEFKEKVDFLFGYYILLYQKRADFSTNSFYLQQNLDYNCVF